MAELRGLKADGEHEPDPEQVALVWIGSDRAVIARWADGPKVEHVESGVPPRRRAVGSVRRGPARPKGGGRVPGHGTKAAHEEALRRFLSSVSDRLEGLEVVEVAGQGTLPSRFAELLRRLGARRETPMEVTTRSLSRRPSDAQLQARLRKLADRDLPRKRVGRYGLPAKDPISPTGRPLRAAAGRRTLRPARQPEWKEIDEQLELLLRELEESPDR